MMKQMISRYKGTSLTFFYIAIHQMICNQSTVKDESYSLYDNAFGDKSLNDNFCFNSIITFKKLAFQSHSDCDRKISECTNPRFDPSLQEIKDMSQNE